MKKDSVVIIFSIVLSIVAVIGIFCLVMFLDNISTPIESKDIAVSFVTDNLVLIDENDWGMKIIYDKNTKIVYVGNFANYASYLSPYLMTNEKDEICGAVWANGKITPAPFAVGSP